MYLRETGKEECTSRGTPSDALGKPEKQRSIHPCPARVPLDTTQRKPKGVKGVAVVFGVVTTTPPQRKNETKNTRPRYEESFLSW